MNISKLKNSLWIEKYRPDALDGYITTDEINDKFKSYIAKNDIPHLLFAGSVGIGKTTAAMLLINNIECDYIVINASDERGIDVIRDKIIPFSQNAGFNPIKIVLLEEADKLTPDAQESLRFTTERYSATTRFIITCNHPELITAALKSRFTPINLSPPSLKDVAKHLFNILNNENVKYEQVDVANLVKEHYPDIRFMIKMLQDDSITGEYKPSNNTKSMQKYMDEIISILKKRENAKTDFEKIRQIVANSGASSFIPFYKKLYSDIDSYTIKKSGIMLIIADSMYKDYFCADKEINAMACLIQIMGIIYAKD